MRRRLAERMTAAIGPAAWVIDDTRRVQKPGRVR